MRDLIIIAVPAFAASSGAVGWLVIRPGRWTRPYINHEAWLQTRRALTAAREQCDRQRDELRRERNRALDLTPHIMTTRTDLPDP